MAKIQGFQIYAGNLSADTTDRILYDFFNENSIGAINAKVVRNIDGSSRCYGFVEYESDESAIKAVSTFSSVLSQSKELLGKTLEVREAYTRSRSEIEQGIDHEKSRAIFVGNLNLMMGDTDLGNSFKKFGPVESYRVVPNRGFGFVVFEENVAAIAALTVMQNVELMGQRIYCTWGRHKDQPQSEERESGVKTNGQEEGFDLSTSLLPLQAAKRIKENESVSRRELLQTALNRSVPASSPPKDDSAMNRNTRYIVKRMTDLISKLS